MCVYALEYMCMKGSRGGIKMQKVQYVGGKGVQRNRVEEKRAKRKSNRTFQCTFTGKQLAKYDGITVTMIVKQCILRKGLTHLDKNENEIQI